MRRVQAIGVVLRCQIPALVRSGTDVVVPPLIALMQDQVDALSALGVRSGFLNSTQDADARRRVDIAVRAASAGSSSGHIRGVS